jgi:hypothetical protein
METMNSLVQIKGVRDGLLATFADAAWEDQCSALLAQIDERPAFFQGARLALDVGSQVLNVFRNAMWSCGLSWVNHR